jgi:hypothetical protein
MRIGLLCPEPFGHGGIGTYSANLSRALVEQGHDVRVILPASSTANAPLSRGLHLVPIAFPERYRLPAFNRHWGLTMGLLPWARAAASALHRSHRQSPFEVIEVPEWMGSGLFLDPRRLPPVVVRLHTHLTLVRHLNDLPMNLDARLAAFLEARALRGAAMILANSRALADRLSADYEVPRDAIDVLPLGVDLARFEVASHGELKSQLGLPAHHVLGLFVGRIERRKGIETLIEAFQRAADEVPYLHLAIAGSDTRTGRSGASMRDDLQHRLRASGLANRVHWLGPVAHEKLPRIYAGSDWLVAPSRLEPFGLVYLEAMATGRPVIAARSGGVPEIVTSGREGILVAPDDPRELAEALIALAVDPARVRRMGMRARARVEAAFDHRVLAERTVHLYRTAIARAQGLARRSS